MKKSIFTIALGLITLLTVSTSFAADAKSFASEKGYTVTDGSKTSAFTQKGKWVYTITRYSSDALPKDIFDIVRNTYDKYYFNGMEKIEQPGNDVVYIVHLENNSSIKTVRVSNGETELVQDFVKG